MKPYDVLSPLLFSLPAETAHRTVSTMLKAIENTPVEREIGRRCRVEDERLVVDTMGLRFQNPVGVAAGFDKNAESPGTLASLGFGHVEVGGVTAQPQAGNPRPRMFRLEEDKAIINRMGFNNHGADVIGSRLAETTVPDVPIGVNMGKSKATPIDRAEEDYLYTYERVAEGGDFFVVNVSSPNTPGLRELQNRAHLERIFETLIDAGASPLLVKLSPDLPDEAIEDALRVVDELELDGVVATNTTTERPPTLRSDRVGEEGGLSGRPLEPRSTATVRFVAERTSVPVVGVGGVFSPEDAYRKIRAGASLVQLYTGLVFHGPAIARDINRGLLRLLERDGFDRVEDAVGVDLD